ncbi:MAG: GNAT family N-acetyltransferase [Clostridia bacterium]|nr:GNAT family N-acetyltransferase [Clostridia bacterium]
MKIDVTNISYKQLTPDYIPELLEIQEETFAHATGSSDFLRRNTTETLSVCFPAPSLVLGAYYEGRMIAFGILHAAGTTSENLAKDIDEVEDVTENANVKLIIVRPDYRGNGLQRALIIKLGEHAKECGFKWLSSTVSPENPWSKNNLEACGFTLNKVLKKYGGLERYLFVKKIG